MRVKCGAWGAFPAPPASEDHRGGSQGPRSWKGRGTWRSCRGSCSRSWTVVSPGAQSPGSPQSHTVWRGAGASDLGQAFRHGRTGLQVQGGIAQGDGGTTVPDLSLCGQARRNNLGSLCGLLFRPPTGARRPTPWEMMRLFCLQTSLPAPSTNDRRLPGEVEKEGGGEAQGLEMELVPQETLIHSSLHLPIH